MRKAQKNNDKRNKKNENKKNLINIDSDDYHSNNQKSKSKRKSELYKNENSVNEESVEGLNDEKQNDSISEEIRIKAQEDCDLEKEGKKVKSRNKEEINNNKKNNNFLSKKRYLKEINKPDINKIKYLSNEIFNINNYDEKESKKLLTLLEINNKEKNNMDHNINNKNSKYKVNIENTKFDNNKLYKECCKYINKNILKEGISTTDILIDNLFLHKLDNINNKTKILEVNEENDENLSDTNNYQNIDSNSENIEKINFLSENKNEKRIIGDETEKNEGNNINVNETNEQSNIIHLSKKDLEEQQKKIKEIEEDLFDKKKEIQLNEITKYARTVSHYDKYREYDKLDYMISKLFYNGAIIFLNSVNMAKKCNYDKITIGLYSCAIKCLLHYGYDQCIKKIIRKYIKKTPEELNKEFEKSIFYNDKKDDGENSQVEIVNLKKNLLDNYTNKVNINKISSEDEKNQNEILSKHHEVTNKKLNKKKNNEKLGQKDDNKIDKTENENVGSNNIKKTKSKKNITIKKNDIEQLTKDINNIVGDEKFKKSKNGQLVVIKNKNEKEEEIKKMLNYEIFNMYSFINSITEENIEKPFEIVNLKNCDDKYFSKYGNKCELKYLNKRELSPEIETLSRIYLLHKNIGYYEYFLSEDGDETKKYCCIYHNGEGKTCPAFFIFDFKNLRVKIGKNDTKHNCNCPINKEKLNEIKKLAEKKMEINGIKKKNKERTVQLYAMCTKKNKNKEELLFGLSIIKK